MFTPLSSFNSDHVLTHLGVIILQLVAHNSLHGSTYEQNNCNLPNKSSRGGLGWQEGQQRLSGFSTKTRDLMLTTVGI